LLVPRPRKLDAERQDRILVLASQGRTLREIGAEVGISHETVRQVLRRSSPAAFAAD
jgi:DNA-binding CsgD family transcriptional regulator